MGAIMQQLRSNQEGSRYNTYPCKHLVQILYDGTTKGCPLRGYVVDMYVRNGRLTFELEKDDEDIEYPQEFLLELVQEFMAPRPSLTDLRQTVGKCTGRAQV